ncbi:phosphonopyruvate decarboxylase-related protein [Thermodesulfatator indicus DSM 15286]|uniref:Phosphonopyruvate decarboxylase-related protein n=1 Tax=Thermodesulfatator indicus (strain DSM 15286 / JCM 11887 / CIR29812) TaxID=667014 RepID=F8ACZ9_THEID|nr:alkaline phosphatase family protein [Thermodesulfatator indicus]AEH45865.1 phosphonopyruvate decarboxylase-related protein [Thermodesulfatator indicus DSM 15286]
MSLRRCILLLLDGLADRAHSVLDNKTPLQAADTPNLDYLAKKGLCGLMHAARPGVPLPSEIAHFAIFGYGKEFPGRGPLEALGAGIDLTPGEVAVLARLVSVEVKNGGLYILEDKFNITDEEKEAIFSAIPRVSTEEIEISFKPISGVRGVLLLKGKVSSHFSDIDPLKKNAPVFEIEPLCSETNTLKTVRALKDYLIQVWRTLEKHPVNEKRRQKGLPPLNFLITHRAGMMGKVEPFPERWGLSAATISSGVIYWGIGKYLGFHVEKAKEIGNVAEEFSWRLKRLRELSDGFSFIHVHHKGPDEAAHRKDPVLKKQVIEALDAVIGENLDWLTSPENLLVVTSDHATPSSGPLVHGGEPVPILIYGAGLWQDKVNEFSEIACAEGALGRIEAKDFMYLILNFLETAVLGGLCYGKVPRPYFPKKTKIFKV